MLSFSFCSSISKVLSSPPPPPPLPPATIAELLERFPFLEFALYLELSLDFVLSAELELDRDVSEIERDGSRIKAMLVKASFPSSMPLS
jgi:hypothetical protein